MVHFAWQDMKPENPNGDQAILIDGVRVPRRVYGTAWKEDQTRPLTELALRQGFRGIDTANQRRHYHEAAVGEAVGAMIQAGVLAREDLFLQTKFTFRRGQDDRLPYDPKAPIGTQVEQSFASSLQHLQTTYIDSFLLHGPTYREGLAPADWEAWQAMEALHASGRVRLLGVSNVALSQLQELCARARVLPRFVQNRCYASRGWDRRVRAFCVARGIVYQGFSLLTANQAVLSHPEVLGIARRLDCGVAQVVFHFAIEVGMIVLTGTTSATHMRDDLETSKFRLTPDDIRRIETLVAG